MKIAVFDLETTGISILEDRIVEIAIFVFDTEDDSYFKYFFSKVNPGILIPEKVSEIHGITDEKVKNSPTFDEISFAIYDMLNGIPWSGYNIKRFDVPLILKEFERLGEEPPKFTGLIDSRDIFEKQFSFKLENAYRFYCGKELGDDAHTAIFDARASMEVLKQQIKADEGLVMKELEKKDIEEMSLSELLEISSKFIVKESKVIFKFGKYAGEEAETRPDYLEWMIKGEFDRAEKLIAKALLKGETP